VTVSEQMGLAHHVLEALGPHPVREWGVGFRLSLEEVHWDAYNSAKDAESLRTFALGSSFAPAAVEVLFGDALGERISDRRKRLAGQ